jgi:KipI family sensor histidine kinase inhibitor
VRYGGESGPDLDEVAALSGLSRGEVVERHAARTYRVFMLGFLPGFAYLGTLDPAIQVPRRTTPRSAVASGSVGLAGAQTGVYPRVSPGGWQIIGRSDVRLFDPGLDPPSRLAPGDRVRFVPVEIAS